MPSFLGFPIHDLYPNSTTMDLTIQPINWVGNIYQKFEEVCQEVDDIVGQDAVKYLENHVQNVGDSVKKFYSGVVHELLPFPTLAGSKYEDHSVALINNIVSSVESVAGCKDNNKERDEENTINNFIKPLQYYNAIDIANNQQAGVPIKHNLVNQVSDETCSDSLEVEDSCINQEEVGDDDSRETSGAKKENLRTSIEEVAVESVPKPMNLISVGEKDPLELPIHCELYSESSDSGCEVSIRTNDSIDVNAGQNACLIVGEENVMNSSTSELLSSQSSDSGCEVSIRINGSIDANAGKNSSLIVGEENAMNSSTSKVSSRCLDEEESIKVSLFSESSDVFDEDTHGILVEVSLDDSVSNERPITKTESVCFKSSITSDSSLYSKSLGGYSFETESCINNSDKSLDSYIDSTFYNIRLNDQKHEESCVYVDDSELYAVSFRIRKLRSYKKRIQDAFTSKKRLVKEYEQLAIWYGDADIMPSKGFSQTSLPFSSKTDMDSENMEEQHDSESEWELL